MLRSLTLLLFILLCACGRAQELPPIVAYDTEGYTAGSQNWMLSQDDNDFLYAANNDGLLEFNGQQWRLHPSPGEAIMRSVRAHAGRIYTGSYMDFGYWTRTEDGRMVYTSLAAKDILADEQFWNIFVHEGYVIFQSLQQFFLYEPGSGTIEIIRPRRGISKSFVTRRGLFFTDTASKLYQLNGGTISAVLTDNRPGPAVVHLWEEGQKILLQTANAGCYALIENRLKRLERHAFLQGKKVYSAVSRRGGGLAFGTISDGIYVVDATGQLVYQLDQTDGLTNNTILSLYEDRRNNLWAGTDNGISYVNLSSPLRKFTDNSGQLGTVYASAVVDGQLYLGSNQGLFVKQLRGEAPLRLVPGTRAQVWTLYVHEGLLFCGHDNGTFVVEGATASPLEGTHGSWTFAPVPGQKNLLLQGAYSGLSVLERTAEGWRVRNKIKGFDYSARYLALRERAGGFEVYVSHEYRGVYGLRVDPKLRQVTELQEYPSPEKGKNAGLTSFQDSVVYYSRNGMFTLIDFVEGFQSATVLNKTISSQEYVSGKMTATEDRLWFFNEESLNFFHRGTLSGGLQRQTIPISAELINAKSGYENITPIGGDTMLIGTADGYLLLALSAIPLHQHELHLTAAVSQSRGQQAHFLPTDDGGSIPYTANNLRFSFAVPAYGKYFTPRFQYRLQGLQQNWSEWSEEAEVTFPSLAFGSYELEVRSLLGRRVSENVLRYPFRIARPWYATYLAYALYLLIAGLLIFLLHRSYTGYYHRKQVSLQAESERLIAARQRETELELTRINNQRLQQDITNKNREMAISTMSLVKKNELLQQIKNNLLADQAPVKNIREVIRTIDKNIDEAGTWLLFKEAFESADREFFKKIKSLHPELTPNDLKLCAYLRLNLSSKEIAPMLNISVRSVEVKRYRLRKKMGLEREVGLVEYILNL